MLLYFTALNAACVFCFFISTFMLCFFRSFLCFFISSVKLLSCVYCVRVCVFYSRFLTACNHCCKYISYPNCTFVYTHMKSNSRICGYNGLPFLKYKVKRGKMTKYVRVSWKWNHGSFRKFSKDRAVKRWTRISGFTLCWTRWWETFGT